MRDQSGGSVDYFILFSTPQNRLVQTITFDKIERDFRRGVGALSQSLYPDIFETQPVFRSWKSKSFIDQVQKILPLVVSP